MPISQANIARLETSIEGKAATLQGTVFNWTVSKLRDYPWRRLKAEPYSTLLAELLLKRTTATSAARLYERFLGQFPSLEALTSASEEGLAQALSAVGLQRQRAEAIKKMATYLEQYEGGEVPCDLQRLLAVPGLGEYSARAVLSFGCGQPVAVVDANVERIYKRVFKGSLPEQVSQREIQELADTLLPKGDHRQFNFGLLDLGSLVCRYVNPRCGECPLNSICDYFAESNKYELRERRSPYAVETVGLRLRQLRKERGISLVALATRSGVSKLTIIKTEAGRTKPTARTLERLAKALGVLPSILT